MVDVALIGVPFDGYGRPGNQACAAAALRSAGLRQAWSSHTVVSDEVLDFGAMNLAPALMLGVVARTMDRRLLRIALQSALLFWTVHFFIHLRYRTPCQPPTTRC